MARATEVFAQGRGWLQAHISTVFQIWFLGALLLALRFAGGWFWLQRIRGGAEEASDALTSTLRQIGRKLGLKRDLKIRISSRVLSPVVTGLIKPMLLMPASLLSGLDPAGLEALLAHELAHIRRHDYLVNVVQCVVEILFFYHPAVWWISRRVRTEREICCDDAAVEWCGDSVLYAETLTRLHAFREEALTPALSAGGGDLMLRIKHLLPKVASADSPHIARFNALALTSLTVLMLFGGVVTASLRAQSTVSSSKWFIAGSNRKDYVLGTDPATSHTGQPSMTLACAIQNPKGFGTIMQTVVPTKFLGKRVRMSAWVKSQDVSGWAGLWMRVDGNGGTVLGFDNMQDRAIKQTTDWQPYEVVLDLSADAKSLSFGLILDGKGKVWLDGLRFEAVGTDVAITGQCPNIAEGEKVWTLSGEAKDYQASMDASNPHDGKPTHVLASTGDTCERFGTLNRGFDYANYAGKRVRLSAWVKSQNVTGWAGLWMRVDGGPGKVLAFDNMSNRVIGGNTDWHKVEVVLDIAPEATGAFYGILLHGKGRVWVDEPVLEVVDTSVPVTDMIKH